MFAKLRGITRKPLLVASITALIVVGAVVGYVFAFQGSLVTPGKTPTNILFLDRYNVTSDANQPNPTVLTMWLRNAGTSTAALNTLTITDLSGGAPATFQLNGQTIVSTGTSTVTVDTLSSGFYFVRGHAYSLTVTTPSGTFIFSPESYP